MHDEPQSGAPRAPDPPIHGLPTPSRFPWLWALLALPAVFIASQLAGAAVGQIAQQLSGEPRESAVPLLAGVAGGHGTLALAVFVLVFAAGLRPLPTLGIGTPRQLASIEPRIWLAAAVGTFMLGPLADTLMTAMQAVFPSSTFGTVATLQRVARDNPVWLTWPFLALLPGVAEELFFRGLLQRAFVQTRVAIAVSGLCFAAFHVDPHHVVGVLPLGLFLAWVASRHGTVVAMLAHVANNSVALLSARVADLDVGYGTPEPMPIEWIPISLVVVALCARTLSTTRSLQR